jgi:hypothetical protein
MSARDSFARALREPFPKPGHAIRLSEMTWKALAAALALMLAAAPAPARHAVSYANPVLDADFPDPSPYFLVRRRSALSILHARRSTSALSCLSSTIGS